MNKEEIEEIENYITELKSMFELSELEEHSKNILKVGNYIKQLQQENKQLKEELKYTVPIVEHNKIVSKKLKENQKYKEVIDKAINNSQYWIDYYTRLNSDERIALRLQENIDILKEVE